MRGAALAAVAAIWLIGASQIGPAAQQPPAEQPKAAPAQPKQAPPAPPPAKLQEVKQPSAAAQTDDRDEQTAQPMAWTEIGTFWATVAQSVISALAFIGLIFTVIYAKRAWEEARKSAKVALDTLEDARKDGAAQADRFLEQMAVATRSAEAATAQIEIANKAYFTENRPWVGLASESIKSLGLRDGRGPRAELVFDFYNSGRTPAHELSLDAFLLPDMSPDKTIAEIERRFRVRPRRFIDDYITTLLPGETFKFEFPVTGSPEAYSHVPADSEGIRSLIFTIGGFVIYKSGLGDPQTHLTSFAYRVMLRGNQPVRWGGASELFEGDQIQIRRWPKGWLAD